MKNIELKIKNESGDILVRATDTCGIVEMMHLYDKNKSGCVIGCWNVRTADGNAIAEFSSIHDRITETQYDSADILLEALKFGQKLADLIVKTI